MTVYDLTQPIFSHAMLGYSILPFGYGPLILYLTELRGKNDRPPSELSSSTDYHKSAIWSKHTGLWMHRENLIAYALLLLSLVALFSFNNSQIPPYSPPPEIKSVLFMHQSLPLQIFEKASEALPDWRQFAETKPTLLLLSNHPFLQPISPKIKEEALKITAKGSEHELGIASDHQLSNFLFTSGMSVELASQHHWISKLVWALPLRDSLQAIEPLSLKQQLQETGILQEGDDVSLVASERILSGNIRQTKIVVGDLSHLPQLEGPLIVHIDLSYFKPLYKNEIATPLIPQVIETLKTLAEKKLQVLQVTFSYGNLDDQIALDVRFLGDILQRLIENPNQLGERLPVNWSRQNDALYLSNFFQKEKIRELFLAQEKDAPESAWVKFNLYRSAAEHKEGSLALDYLRQAVALDRMYALEYFNLAELAYTRNRPDESIRMLNLALQIFPENAKAKISIAQLAAETGDKHTALQLLNQLQGLNWSKIYNPEIPDYLEKFTAYLNDVGEKQP